MVVEHPHRRLKVEELNRINLLDRCIRRFLGHDELMQLFRRRVLRMSKGFRYTKKKRERRVGFAENYRRLRGVEEKKSERRRVSTSPAREIGHVSDSGDEAI